MTMSILFQTWTRRPAVGPRRPITRNGHRWMLRIQWVGRPAIGPGRPISHSGHHPSTATGGWCESGGLGSGRAHAVSRV
jgi:hypothetical protein